MSLQAETDRKIERYAGQLRGVVLSLCEAGASPGVLAGALVRVTYDLMKAQEMSDMQAANQLQWIVDEIREMHYQAGGKKN